MRKSGSRIKCDVDRIHSDSFVEFCRNGNPKVFVRNRKMPLDDLAFSMINRKGFTLKLELRGYMNISHPGIQISKPGYLKQRMKLNPAAFVDLYQFHNRNYYSDPETELYTVNPSGPISLQLHDQALLPSGHPAFQCPVPASECPLFQRQCLVLPPG